LFVADLCRPHDQPGNAAEPDEREARPGERRQPATNQVGHRPVRGGAESRVTDQGSEDDDASDR
jgi:hypothetical protein